jgi:gamma-glutamyltranspeptidase/glutathione hydrolase
VHGERDLQAAIDAPTVHSEHMPSSFWPRRARPGVVSVESRLDPAVLRALESRGHRLDRKGPWDHGRVLAATADPAGGPNEAAASPRFAIAYAIALP